MNSIFTVRICANGEPRIDRDAIKLHDVASAFGHDRTTHITYRNGSLIVWFASSSADVSGAVAAARSEFSDDRIVARRDGFVIKPSKVKVGRFNELDAEWQRLARSPEFTHRGARTAMINHPAYA